MREVAERLRALGHTVECRWIEGHHAHEEEGAWGTEEFEAKRRTWGQHDLEDLSAADCCVLFTEDPARKGGAVRGGRHFEFGYARGVGMRLITVGPIENVFHGLDPVENVATKEDLYRLLGDTTHFWTPQRADSRPR